MPRSDDRLTSAILGELCELFHDPNHPLRILTAIALERYPDFSHFLRGRPLTISGSIRRMEKRLGGLGTPAIANPPYPRPVIAGSTSFREALPPCAGL